jgi:hypothetical protein
MLVKCGESIQKIKKSALFLEYHAAKSQSNLLACHGPERCVQNADG